jgi:UDP-N-acetylglucosamine 2-epimerase (non-hydrolysing)
VLEDLGLPEPDRFLGVGSGLHGEQTAKALMAFEQVLLETTPDLVVVAGDVNSTLACALAASKLGIAIAHVESGQRSRDWSMPQEIKRVLTDRLSDVLFIHSPEAHDNLLAEGIAASSIHHVGNTMIDSLYRFRDEARARAAWERAGVSEREYVLVTLHRPSNVDDPERLGGIADALARLAAQSPVVFPVHPRTRARLVDAGRLDDLEAAGVRCGEPRRYRDFLSLEIAAGAILTDSGGVQEEAAALGVPCFTFRRSTERPITLTEGTNVLLGDDPESIARVKVSDAPRGDCRIPLWDGRSGERIADVLCALPQLMHEVR